MPIRKRSIIYIDGFNFYYGLVRGGPYKWLNLERYFSRLRPDDDIQVIRYFTAMVRGRRRVNQETYLKALETLPSVRVYFGRFKDVQTECKVASCQHVGSRLFRKPEEKRTDVAIGVHMLKDAFTNSCDRLVVVSGDSDLVPAVDMVKSTFPLKEVIVYVPARNLVRGAAVELRAAADKDRTCPLNLLQYSLFPANVPDGCGGFIQKPAGW